MTSQNPKESIMKKAFIIIVVLMLIGGGAGYYYYDREQKRIAAEKATHDSLRLARELNNARLAALEKAHRDSLAEYEKTHSPQVIRAIAEKMISEEMMSGRNRIAGSNWSERICILREQCDNVLAYSDEEADSIFRSFSFKGLMGKDIHIYSDSITHIYYIAPESAYVDVLFNIGEEYPGQKVICKLAFEDERWVIDDFIFEYSDGDVVSESEEMSWFLEEYGGLKDDDEGKTAKSAEKSSTTKGSTDKGNTAKSNNNKERSDKSNAAKGSIAKGSVDKGNTNKGSDAKGERTKKP